MISGSMLFNLFVATNVLLNIAKDGTDTGYDADKCPIDGDNLMLGLVSLSSKVIDILHTDENLPDSHIRKEIAGYSDTIEGLDGLFYLKGSGMDEQTENLLEKYPSDLIARELIGVIFGLLSQPGKNDVHMMLRLQTEILAELSDSGVF